MSIAHQIEPGDREPAHPDGVGLPWDVPVADPIAALAAARTRHGDTFVVNSGDDRYLFTFSPAGVRSFYGLGEAQASKGLADWRMLRRKLPDEVFAGRRTLPHELFGRDDVATIATLLPLTNTTAAPGLDRWDPDRWTRRRLTAAADLPTAELVTAFGHGRHTCPAQPFSLSAMTATLTRLTSTYELTPAWTDHPHPVPAQIGGVARAEGPCPLQYSRR